MKTEPTRLQELARLVAANQRPPMKITYPTRHLFDYSEAELVEKFQGRKITQGAGK